MNTINLTDHNIKTLIHTAICSANTDLADGYYHTALMTLQAVRPLIDQASEPLGDVVDSHADITARVCARINAEEGAAEHALEILTGAVA